MGLRVRSTCRRAVRGGLIEVQLVLVKAQDDGERRGVAHVEQCLAKEGRSNFENFDLRCLTNPARDCEGER
jgi:hypothetical protein